MELTPLQRQVRASDLPIEKLSTNKSINEKEKITEVSRQFEAVLLRQILGSAQKTHFNSKYADNSTAGGIYKDMVTNQFADGISKSGALGFGKVLAAQMSHGATRKSTEAPTGTAANSISNGAHRFAAGAAEPKPHPVPSKGAYHSNY